MQIGMHVCVRLQIGMCVRVCVCVTDGVAWGSGTGASSWPLSSWGTSGGSGMIPGAGGADICREARNVPEMESP